MINYIMIPERFRKIFFSGLFVSFTLPLIFANTIISLVIALPLISPSFEQNAWSASVTRIIPYIAHFFFLNLIVGGISFMAAGIFSRKLSGVLSILLFATFQAVLFIDTRIYDVFHYHINGLVLNIMTTAGAADSIFPGRGTILTLLFIVIALSLFVIASYLIALKASFLSGRKAVLFRRSIWFLFLAGVCLILTDKALYAYGDLMNNTGITSNARILPLYSGLTIKRFASSVLGIQVDREDNFRVMENSSAINYPKAPLQFSGQLGKKYNIVIIVIDGLRSDMLDPEVMPNVWNFSRNNIVFSDHYSGGNGTRFGIFTLLYGIHGTYWHNFLAYRVPPVLIDTLLDGGYDINIFSSTRLTFPEFRKTAFLRVPDHISDSFPDETAIPERDWLITDRFIEHLKSRDRNAPLFTFLYYNSSHQPFTYPKEFEKFRPVFNREINYFSDANRENAPLIMNKYKNAVFYSDHLAGMVINALRTERMLEDTIVIITGDHGEEFYENGFLGHTSAFTDSQLRTAFVMKYPGHSSRTVTKITSHLDLVPTLMETLGCVSPYHSYSQGIPLLGNGTHDFITATNWDTAAMIDGDLRIVFSTEMHALSGIEIRSGRDYSLIKNNEDLLKARRQHLIDLAGEMSYFYQ